MNIDQYIFFRNSRFRQLLIFALTLTSLSWFILWMIEFLKSIYKFPNFILETPEAILVPAFFLFLILLFILTEKISKWFIDLEKKNNTYKFRSQNWPSEWIFNGKTEPISISELFVKSSRAGCLLENYIWKNFKMTFELKFLGDLYKHVGIIFKAVDLDNYFMLEIMQDSPHHGTPDGGNKSGIKPHVRYRGAWEIIYFNERKDFDFSNFVNITLEVKENTVSLYYSAEMVFAWVLPTHVDVNHVEAGSKLKEKDGKDTLDKEIARTVQEIPFRLDYGMVGFRAHPGQGAIIRGLKIQPL